MICKDCGLETTDKIKELVKQYEVPFACKTCGGIKFPLKAMRDIVFVWPLKPVEKIGLIHIPPSVAANRDTEYGMVLAAGKSYTMKSGKVVPIDIVIGDEIMVDKTTPWFYPLMAEDGKKYRVKFMGYNDIFGIV